MEFSTPQRDKYDSPNVSSTSSTTTPITSLADEAPATAAARAHRTKLSSHDIRLILYLTSSIKPFKYIGDRSLSQTKKWEAIQQRYGHLKRLDGAAPGSVVIPTIRTLQRQLSSAIRKASARRSESKRLGKYAYHPEQDIASEESRIDAHVSMDSSLPELENALLELNDLSERYRSGKDAKAKGESPAADTAADTIASASEASSGAVAAAAVAEDPQLALIRAEIESVLPKDTAKAQSVLKAVDSIQAFLHESLRVQAQLNRENLALVEETDRLVRSQQAYATKVRELTDNYDKTLAGLRGSVATTVVDYLIDIDAGEADAVRKSD